MIREPKECKHPQLAKYIHQERRSGKGVEPRTPACPRPPFHDRLYLGVLEERLGVAEGGIPDTLSDENLMRAFGTSLKRRSKDLPCFGAGVMSSAEWWTEVVLATFRGAGVSDETLGIHDGGVGGGTGDGGSVFDDVFDRLFHDIFTSTAAWELVPVSYLYMDSLIFLCHRCYFCTSSHLAFRTNREICWFGQRHTARKRAKQQERVYIGRQCFGIYVSVSKMPCRCTQKCTSGSEG